MGFFEEEVKIPESKTSIPALGVWVSVWEELLHGGWGVISDTSALFRRADEQLLFSLLCQESL